MPPFARATRCGRALVRYRDGGELHLFVYPVVLHRSQAVPGGLSADAARSGRHGAYDKGVVHLTYAPAREA
jgi:hypothetical protein